MLALRLERAKVHHLQVDPNGVPVLLTLKLCRIGTKLLEQAAQLDDLSRAGSGIEPPAKPPTVT
jgi:hypothetical protein